MIVLPGFLVLGSRTRKREKEVTETMASWRKKEQRKNYDISKQKHIPIRLPSPLLTNPSAIR